jgi:8-oxo-dGTP diphosphatase
MHSFRCKIDSTYITLNEHISYKWLRKYELKNLDWAAADIPIVDKLMNDA